MSSVVSAISPGARSEPADVTLRSSPPPAHIPPNGSVVIRDSLQPGAVNVKVESANATTGKISICSTSSAISPVHSNVSLYATGVAPPPGAAIAIGAMDFRVIARVLITSKLLTIVFPP